MAFGLSLLPGLRAFVQRLSMTAVALKEFPSSWHWWGLGSVYQIGLLVLFFFLFFFFVFQSSPPSSSREYTQSLVPHGLLSVMHPHQYLFITHTLRIHSGTFVSWLLLKPGSDNSADSWCCRKHWILPHCVKEDCKDGIHCDLWSSLMFRVSCRF